MKLLQFNITSLNTSLKELWGYLKENNYDAKFLQETNYTAGKSLAYFKYWKTKMFTNFQNKAMGFGVGTLVSSAQKMFSETISHTRTQRSYGMKCKYKGKTLVGNIYIPPGNENHLHILVMELEKHKGENILLIGDFNSRNKIWDRNTNHNSRMGLILEDIINQHGLYITTNTDFTYQQSTMVSNSGKSTIDLTLTCGLKNIKVVTKDFTLIKTRHKTTEILIEQEPSFKPNPNFRTKNVDWEKWKQFLQAPLEDYSTNFPLEISEKVLDQHANKLTNLIVGSATSFFVDLTEISNKRAKGWWNNNIKAARKEMKESVRRYKLRQSPANLRKMEEVKEKYQTAISEAKLKQYKSNTKFLNESKDSTQFWHRYNKVLGKKTNNIVEPIYLRH